MESDLNAEADVIIEEVIKHSEILPGGRIVENGNGNGKRKRMGKRKICELLDTDIVAGTSEEYEQLENVESGDDYEPNIAETAGGEEKPDEGTSSQSARKRKRKRKSDDSDGELETFERFAEKNHDANHFYPPDKNVHRNRECGRAGEAKSTGRKKRKLRKVKRPEVDKEDADAEWVKSLKGPHLRLILALKELGMERVKTTKEDSLYNCLTPAALRAIGIIIEEHVKEQLSSLGSGPPGDGVETRQNGDSVPDGVHSADSGHRVDGMKAKDGESHWTSKRKSKSSTNSEAVELVEDGANHFVNDLQRQQQGLGFRVEDRQAQRNGNSQQGVFRSSASSEGLIVHDAEINTLFV